MRKLSFFPRLAWQSVRNNRRFYVPYILTVLGTTAAFYILSALFFQSFRLLAAARIRPIYRVAERPESVVQ